MWIFWRYSALVALLLPTVGCTVAGGSPRATALDSETSRTVRKAPTDEVTTRVAADGRLLVQGADREAVWDAVVDVLEEEFGVADEAHGEAIGDNAITTRAPPVKPVRTAAAQSVEPAFKQPLQSRETPEPGDLYFRRSFAHLAPSEEGLSLDLKVFQEVPVDQVSLAMLDAAVEADPGVLANPEDVFGSGDGWFTARRDSEREQELQERIQNRLQRGCTDHPDEVPAPSHWDYFCNSYTTPVRKLWPDQKNFYDGETLLKLGVALGIAGISANTTVDSKFDAYFQNHIRTSSTDKFVSDIKWMGDGTATMPIILGVTLLTSLTDQVPGFPEANAWGTRTLRGYAVGLVPMLVLQRVLGAARPDQTPDGSHWTPFQYAHGVSGDAFMSSVPLIAAAKMTDNLVAKTALYTVSVLPAIGRINDHDHYLSQAFLGWFLGYLAVAAIDDTDQQWENCRIMPVGLPGGVGLGGEVRW